MQASPLTATVRPDARFLLAHPAHLLALGCGSGLSRYAPGTVGTLWAWLVFVVLQPGMTDQHWLLWIALSLPLGWWACRVTARDLGALDPSCVVWDEVVAFWLLLWIAAPTGFASQLAAFLLFRYFDAVKPGPVAWADELFHDVDPASDPHAWSKASVGILLDDLVASACALLVIAAWKHLG